MPVWLHMLGGCACVVTHGGWVCLCGYTWWVGVPVWLHMVDGCACVVMHGEWVGVFLHGGGCA